MLHHKREIVAWSMAILSSLSYGQGGAIDPWFNHGDVGFGNGDGADGVSVRTTVLQPDGKILISGDFENYNGTRCHRIARLNANGTLDTTFSTGQEITSTWAGQLTYEAIAVQPDGKIVVAGNFYVYGGIPRGGILRFGPDGQLDTSFHPVSGTDWTVDRLVLQEDGKMVIAGNFNTYDGWPRNGLARVNPDGSLDATFDPGLGSEPQPVQHMVGQADGKFIVSGSFTSYDGHPCNGMARVNMDGSYDTGFDVGQEPESGYSVQCIQNDGKVLVTGGTTTEFGPELNRFSRLNVDGSLDETFAATACSNDWVWTAAVASDGKIVVGGEFTSFGLNNRKRIARLNSDGTLDTGFQPGAGADDWIKHLAVQPDGKIVIVGEVLTYDGVTRNRVARVNADGSIDLGFNTGSGSNGSVNDMAVLPDDRILVVGGFTTMNGVPQNRIARLHPDGDLDEGFDPGTGANDWIRSVAVQPDGKYVIVGVFDSYDGTARNHVARINTDGSLDTGFDPGSGAGVTAGDAALAVRILSDGKCIIAGSFDTYDGVVAHKVARLNADGSLDPTFNAGEGPDGSVRRIAVQQDGKILIAGEFPTCSGFAFKNIARLDPDGGLDLTFNPGTGASSRIYSLALQPDGKILIGGAFTQFNGSQQLHMARLNPDGSLDPGFNTIIGQTWDGVKDIALQADGRILIGGAFNVCDGTVVHHLTRLTTAGARDTTFDTGTGAAYPDFGLEVASVELQSDGRILIGGFFTSYDSTGRNRIARILNVASNAVAERERDINGLYVYPNPTTGQVTLSCGMTGNLELLITDLTGKIVLRDTTWVGHTGTLAVDLSDRSAGMYMLRISGPDGARCARVSVQ